VRLRSSGLGVFWTACCIEFSLFVKNRGQTPISGEAPRMPTLRAEIGV
jgi:hypothetical protein